jgi:hypothetical protein
MPRKLNFRWKVVWGALVAALLILYSPIFVYLGAVLEPQSLEIGGARFRTADGWRVDFDDMDGQGVRLIAMSRVNVVTPWTKRKRLLIREHVREYMIPESLRLSSEHVETPLGLARVQKIDALLGRWSPGVTAGSKFALLTQQGVLIQLVETGDLIAALTKAE